MIVSPSILSADFGRLDQDIEMINRSEAGWIHCDVMDGVFVPNISFGFPVIEAVARKARKPLDVHLMIVNPQNYVSQVRDCGAEIMNVHQEACVHLHRTVQAIKDAGMKAAVTLNPATPVETLVDILPDLYMVLLMSVNPGFGGQKYIVRTADKVRRLRAMIAEAGSDTLIQVDGGINLDTVRLVAEAGADSVVAGSAVFKSTDPEAYIRELARY
ncbi:MAG: ribulose-phosphate 3-epimerase [Muribaculaceae bacterium]|nr:ribulose-phosphate 3-epimerase [Muribaculaceae bacterium]MDE5929675.1 ribulose-phosphate 3-epimerase [Muribaculaceae bacterium]